MLVVREVAESRHGPVRHHHDVPGGVRVDVEQRGAGGAPMHDVGLGVGTIASEDALEHRAGTLSLGAVALADDLVQVGAAPARPEVLETHQPVAATSPWLPSTSADDRRVPVMDPVSSTSGSASVDFFFVA